MQWVKVDPSLVRQPGKCEWDRVTEVIATATRAVGDIVDSVGGVNVFEYVGAAREAVLLAAWGAGANEMHAIVLRGRYAVLTLQTQAET